MKRFILMNFSTPTGMICNLYGRERGSMHDGRMFAESQLLQQLTEKMEEFDVQYCVYGDSGYGENPVIRRPFSNAATLQDQLKRQQNKAMSSVRQAVEWGFKEVNTKFAFVDYKKQMRLFEKLVNVLYRVAVLLANCHNCLHPNQASKYFDLEPPNVEDYLSG